MVDTTAIRAAIARAEELLPPSNPPGFVPETLAEKSAARNASSAWIGCIKALVERQELGHGESCAIVALREWRMFSGLRADECDRTAKCDCGYDRAEAALRAWAETMAAREGA